MEKSWKNKKKSEYKISDKTVDKMYSYLYHGFNKKFGLKAGDSVIMSIIISFSEMGRVFFMSQETLAYILCTSPQTINERLSVLEGKGLIKRCGKSEYGTIQWEITDGVKSELVYFREQIGKTKNLTKETLDNN